MKKQRQPENDFRGLSRSYIQKRGEEYYLYMVLWTIAATLNSCAMFFLAASDFWLAAILSAAAASVAWWKTIRNARNAMRFLNL